MIFRDLVVSVSLASVFFLWGCSSGGAGQAPETMKQAAAFNDLRMEVLAIVADPERAADALSLVDTLERELIAFQEDIRQRRQRMQALNANFDASRADFDALISASNLRIRENRQRLEGFRRSLRETLTNEELEALGRVQTQTIKSAINALSAAYQEV